MARPILTLSAVVRCEHLSGKARLRARRRFCRIGRDPVLSRADAVGRPISGCFLNPLLGQLPCSVTTRVFRGYSRFIRLARRPVILSTLKGSTNGQPPLPSRFSVARPARRLARARE